MKGLEAQTGPNLRACTKKFPSIHPDRARPFQLRDVDVMYQRHTLNGQHPTLETARGTTTPGCQT